MSADEVLLRLGRAPPKGTRLCRWHGGSDIPGYRVNAACYATVTAAAGEYLEIRQDHEAIPVRTPVPNRWRYIWRKPLHLWGNLVREGWEIWKPPR